MMQPIFKVEFLTHVTNRIQSLGKQDIGRAALQPPVGTRKEEANVADSAANEKISRSMHSEPFGAHVHAKTGPLCRKKKLHIQMHLDRHCGCVPVCRKNPSASVGRANHFLQFGSRQMRSMSSPPSTAKISATRSVSVHIKRTGALASKYYKMVTAVQSSLNIISIRCSMHAYQILPSAFILDAILKRNPDHTLTTSLRNHFEFHHTKLY